MTSWVAVGPESSFEPGSASRHDVAGYRLAFVRIGDELYVIGDRCSHEDYSLSEGIVLEEERELECAKHGSTFSLETGEPASLPATKPVPVFAVRIVDGMVEVGLPEDARSEVPSAERGVRR